MKLTPELEKNKIIDIMEIRISDRFLLTSSGPRSSEVEGIYKMIDVVSTSIPPTINIEGITLNNQGHLSQNHIGKTYEVYLIPKEDFPEYWL